MDDKLGDSGDQSHRGDNYSRNPREEYLRNSFVSLSISAKYSGKRAGQNDSYLSVTII